MAAECSAVIFTHDADFLSLAVNRQHDGVIFVHRQKYSVGECIRKLRIVAETKSAHQMKNQIFFL